VKPKTLALTGAKGQLGRTIQACWASNPLKDEYSLQCFDRSQLDITDSVSISETLNSRGIECIINAAAYTAVDKAESDPDSAQAVNELGAENLARWCGNNNAYLIHVSTDFVFSGIKAEPYLPYDACGPQGVYGKTKQAGEDIVLKLLPQRSLVVRASWMYSEYGSNFVKTMLKLMAEKEFLSVVNDQTGSPTSAHSLANFLIAAAADKQHSGIFHWSDGGELSWYDFAVAIQEEGLKAGLLGRQIPISPVPATEYPTPAKRPAYSVLDRSQSILDYNLRASSWREELVAVINRIGSESKSVN
jgi:dTDP-4-dehydrorhamnose reductase